MSTCIPCGTWVKRGAAQEKPDKVKLAEEEMESIVNSMNAAGIDDGFETEEEEDVVEGAVAASSGGDNNASRKRKRAAPAAEPDESEESSGDKEDESDTDKKYGLSDYDDDDDEFTKNLQLANIVCPVYGKKDPYIEDDEDSEEEEIQPDDNLLVLGKKKRDECAMEVYVYNEKADNCWCIHDFVIPTFPLAMEWMDFDLGSDTKGNFVALGTMAPDIEIWDLDVINSLEPVAKLAGAEMKKSKKKKKLKKASSGHTDAVLGLSWNKLQRNVLASASADFTIGIWDLTQGTMVTSIEKHEEKVQTVQWHPFEAQSLVSGSFDNTAKIYDCRSPNDTVKSWTLPGEVEKVRWNHQDPYYFFASSDNGHVYYLDVRASDPVFTLKAHTGAVTGLELSSSLPNCLVTSSQDKSMKVWDISNNKPDLVYSKDLPLGTIFFASANPDSGTVFAFGGENDFRVIDLSKNSHVMKHFNESEVQEEVEEADEEVPIIGGVDEDEPEEAAAAVPVAVEEKPKKKKKKKKSKKPAQETQDA